MTLVTNREVACVQIMAKTIISPRESFNATKWAVEIEIIAKTLQNFCISPRKNGKMSRIYYEGG